jgi:hypothetical protein
VCSSDLKFITKHKKGANESQDTRKAPSKVVLL